LPKYTNVWLPHEENSNSFIKLKIIMEKKLIF
jgi:hypothetical protein